MLAQRAQRQQRTQPRQAGAVITFKSHVSLEDAKRFINEMRRRHGNCVESAEANDFNPDHGTLAFYIP